jgi:aspartyl-tRNA(Asn)/glutamyl-tRNA(Gln) amidotransferase subunit C
MPVTLDDVLKIADLAHLHFDEAEAEAFTRQFQHILDYIEKLREVDTAGIEATSHVSLTKDFEQYIFREDEIRPSLPLEESLGNAPDADDGHFSVPRVI